MKSKKKLNGKDFALKAPVNTEKVEIRLFNGLELPFDQSLTGFAKSFSNPDFNGGRSPHPNTIKQGIDHLSYESKPSGNYSFDSPNTLFHIISSFQQKGQKNAPIPIPWEIDPILSALVCARADESGNKSCSGEALARAVLNQLVGELSKKNDEKITGDYRWLRILEHPTIKLSTVHLFDQEINDRLQVLSSLIQNRSLTLSAKYTKKICRTLDSLAVEILSSQSETPPQTPAHQVIEELCGSLLQPRNEARNPRIGTTFFQFAYTPSEKSELSAKNLCQLLEKCEKAIGKKNRQEVLATSDSCQAAYNQYLTNCLREKQKIKGETPPFDAEFLSLRSYFRPYTKDELHRALKEQMYHFVRTQFDQLEKLTLLPYHYDPSLEFKADLSLGTTILENEQQHIIADLHQSFRLLNIVGALFIFTPFLKNHQAAMRDTKGNDTSHRNPMEGVLDSENIKKLVAAMDDQFQQLSQRNAYPGYVAIPDNPADFPTFWSAYATIAREVFQKLSITEDLMNSILYSDEPTLSTQLATTYAKLLYQTELYACCAAKSAVQDVENTLAFYNDMLDHYKSKVTK